MRILFDLGLIPGVSNYLCQMASNTSPHILSTSANLLGFCLIVITSLHIANKTEVWMVDEISSVVAIMLIFSCVFSFFLNAKV